MCVIYFINLRDYVLGRHRETLTEDPPQGTRPVFSDQRAPEEPCRCWREAKDEQEFTNIASITRSRTWVSGRVGGNSDILSNDLLLLLSESPGVLALEVSRRTARPVHTSTEVPSKELYRRWAGEAHNTNNTKMCKLIRQ